MDSDKYSDSKLQTDEKDVVSTSSVSLFLRFRSMLLILAPISVYRISFRHEHAAKYGLDNTAFSAYPSFLFRYKTCCFWLVQTISRLVAIRGYKRSFKHSHSFACECSCYSCFLVSAVKFPISKT